MTSKENKPPKEGKKKVDSTSSDLLKSLSEINDLPEEITCLLKDVTNLKELGSGETEKLLKCLRKYMIKISSLLMNQREGSGPSCDTAKTRGQRVTCGHSSPSDEVNSADNTNSCNDACQKNASPDVEKPSTIDLEHHRSALSVCISVVRWIVDTWGSKEIIRSFSLPRVYILFASYLMAETLDFRLRNQMSAVCEKLVDNMLEEDCMEAGFFVVVFVLDLTLDTSKRRAPTKADIKRVWSVHKIIGRLNLLDPTLDYLFDKLLVTTVHKSYLNCKEGRQHIAHLMSLNETIAKRVYAEIIDRLPSMAKAVAANYGEILFTAWNTSLPGVKKIIEEECIQDLMRRIFTLKRSGMNFDKMGQIVFEILKQLHDSRKTYAFSTVITTLYTPLIWRYIRSGNPLERCNAAQVFMDVFPLEKSTSGFVENMQYKERQFKEIMDLLLDSYHIVRIIAIKGVCHHLMQSLECFVFAEVRTLLKTLVDSLANDGSTYQVRLAVFEGFATMIKRKEAAILLEPILPQITDHIHDDNEKVRSAFVTILQNIKDNPEATSLSYWNVVPINHLAARLELEGPVVGEPLVNLIMSNFYVEDVPLDKFVSRLIRLVHMNAKAARKLFQYSCKLLTVNDVHKIVIGILGHLRRKAKEILDEAQKDYDENDSAKEVVNQAVRRKRKKDEDILADVSNLNIEERDKSSSSNDSTASIPAPNSNRGHDPVLNRGLLECACMVWSVFSDQLNLPENEKFLTDLYTMACNTIPLFLRAYRGTEMYYATVYFASLVPLFKLAPFSTISGACMSELAMLTNMTPPSQTQCLVYSLCAWNRGSQVIDLAAEWLDYAFRNQQLNTSAFLLKDGRRKRKVRFELAPGKPLLGLKLLDCIFCDFINEKRLLDKSYEHLYELYMYMERIKILIQRRVERNAPFNEIELCDDFLHLVLKRYLLLAHTLHRPDKPPNCESFMGADELSPVNASEETISSLEWAECVLINALPMCVDPMEEKSLVVKCLMEILRSANYAVHLNTTDKLMCQKLAAFAIKLLSSGCGIWFVEDCLCTVQAFSAHAEVYTPKDEWGLLMEVISPLYRKCLDAFVETRIDKDNLNSCFNNKGAKLRNGLVSYLSVLNRMYGKKCIQFIETFNMLMNCCIHITLQKILMDEEIQTNENLTDQPFMVGLIMKILFSNATFTANVLPSFQRFFTLYKQDGNLLTSCISLLNSVVRTHLAKLKRAHLEELMREVYSTFMAYKKSIASDNSSSNSSRVTKPNDSSFCSNQSHIDAVKYAEPVLMDLGKFSCCALMPSATNNTNFM